MVAAVVLTVKTDVPDPFATEVGLSEHVGGRVATGVMLQVRFTVPVKACGATVIVDVVVPPAATEAGESVVPVTVKSATVRLRLVLWFAGPVPETVTV